MNAPVQPASLFTATPATRGGHLETVLSVHHWTDDYFSFCCTRDPGLRFTAGQFVMIGLVEGEKLIRRAYSIASAPWEEQLEFFSIKVADGELTSRLQLIQPGDSIWVSEKPVGTLVLHDLRPGKRLWLLATGTGLAPYLSLLRDLDLWASDYESVILVHGVREARDLAYAELLERELPLHEYLGPLLAGRFRYLPMVSREAFALQGRVTDLLADPTRLEALDLAPLDPSRDRLMLCGSPSMLADCRQLLDGLGFSASPRQGVQGDYVFERAFVER